MNSTTQDIRGTQEEGSKDEVSKSTTVSVSTLVSGLTKLVGTVGSSTNPGVVTAFIPSSSNSKLASVVAKPILVGAQTLTQPLLLPKPSIQHKQVIPSTPPKVNYITNQSLLNSPLHASPSHSWNPSSPYNRKRPLQDGEAESLESKRRRTPSRCTNEKGGKGLRHFSMKVCEKVQLKGVTTYNEVADELVQEFSDKSDGQSTEQSYDQKNIRRRVYDALNVLKAMNIITNEKKEIRWVGLPTNSAQECKHLEDQKSERSERIRQKMQQLKELIVQQIAFKNLVERNKRMEKTSGAPPPNACIHLPFIIVNTSKKTVIDCSISSDKSEYLFNFDEAFEIHDDIEVLKRMGLSLGLEKGECSESDLTKATKMVPKVLEPYVMQMAKGTYGNPDLIQLEASSNTHFSPLTFQQSSRQGSSTTTTATRKVTATRTQLATTNRRTALRTSSALSAASDYDSENEGDDERTITES